MMFRKKNEILWAIRIDNTDAVPQNAYNQSQSHRYCFSSASNISQ